MCTAHAAQSQTVQFQDALHMRKQHLHFLALPACLLVSRRVGDSAGHFTR